MTNIHTDDDLKRAWATLLFMIQIRHEFELQGRTDFKKSDAYMLELKQAIREYNRRQASSDRRMISSDSDSYVVLVDVPENVTDVDEWFDLNERLECRPSMYDCTGQAFTMWYKVCERGGGRKVYHCVGFDV